MPGRVSSPDFVGRSAELAELRAAYERAAGGEAAAVLVGGEAGVGKTRLVGEVASSIRQREGTVLEGRCADLHEAAIPLLAITEALATLPPSARSSSELVDLGRGVAPGVLVFEPVLELLHELSSASPVLLSIDDLHWADRTTLDLVTFLIARLHDERVLLVLTHRSDEVDRRAGLRAFLAEAGRRPSVERLELERLTRAEATEQLAGILGAVPDRGLADAIFQRADGNPLFAEELVSVAGNAGASVLPATLRDMLLMRIAALAAPAQEVVRAAAVGGRRVHHLLLGDVAGQDERQLTTGIRAAVRDHVLVADGDELAFRHPLLQEAAYAELLPGERAQLHAAFAEALEARSGLTNGTAATVAAEIAHHWWRAGDRPRALGSAVRAGVAAEGVPAPAEAAEHFSRALELWDAVDDPEERAGVTRVELLTHAAEAVAWSGDPGRATALAGDALALVDETREPGRAALLHERRGWYSWWEGRAHDMLDDYEEAVRLIRDALPSLARASALAGRALALLHCDTMAAAYDACDEALTAAREEGAQASEALVLAVQGSALASLGDASTGIARMREAVATAREAGDPDVLARTYSALCDALRRGGQLEESLELSLEAVEHCRRAGLDAAHGSFNALSAAEAAIELGRWSLADPLVADVLADEGGSVTSACAHYMHGVLAVARGEFDVARADVKAQRELSGDDPPPKHDCYALELEAELEVWEGNPDAAALAAARGHLVASESEDAVNAARLATIAVRAEADRAQTARDRGDDASAGDACDRARRLRAQTRAGASVHPALVATIDAETARAEGRAAPQLWEAAANAHDACGSEYAAAYARWRGAEALLAASSRRPAATDSLRAAWAIAERLGARPLVGEIEALARRARIDLAAPTPGASGAAALPDAARELDLTTRELEVLEHVALGQTNREIAADLFISPRTAGVHVSHILEKLGASTRTEAAAAAHRLGLVS
jgi:ATP/maltotriose-dependent transcriptional regulator MalT